MSGHDPDRLAALLPDVYRVRDAAIGGPLRDLLSVVGEQVGLVEADIARLYANWFIETCDEWVVPYIGDLIGYRPVGEAGQPGGGAGGQPPRAILSARREVANTIANRRRKGTVAILEQLAADVAGWPARAVEFFSLLVVAQSLNHLRLARGRLADLREADALDRLGGAFDDVAHLVDVRRIGAARSPGRHNIGNVGLFVWRLRAYPITRGPAQAIDRTPNRYTFSILGNDTRLLTLPVAEPTPIHIAEELNVPAPIRRRAFDERPADYYGPGRSLAIWRDRPDNLVPLERVVPADLSSWTAYRPARDEVAVDPELGRILFSPRNPPEDVWVSYHYGFSDDLGGGEYRRTLWPVAGRPVYRVGRGQRFDTIMAAVRRWGDDKAGDPAAGDAVIEIADSGSYREPIDVWLDPGDRLELRAAQGARPAIGVLDWSSGRQDSVRVRNSVLAADGDAAPDAPAAAAASEDEAGPPRLLLDGLLVAGGPLRVEGPVASVHVRHCTLVPGWRLEHDCEPSYPESPSIVLRDTATHLVVQHSILGTIEVNENEVDIDPIQVEVEDSILDATSSELDAVTAPEDRHAHAVLTLRRCTVIGGLSVHAVALAEDSILDGRVLVVRRRTGCVRFCYVAPRSRTPRRYSCQPDLVVAAVRARFGDGPLDAAGQAARAAAEARAVARVRPQLNSRRYGTQDYGQLAATCAPEITGGAESESEMGAFHDLYQPQRRANLETRLDEFTPAGMDAGIVYVT
jgi:hypothetical protein